MDRFRRSIIYPAARGLLGPSRQAWLAVSCDAEERAIRVFADITEFENLPEDGRAPPRR